MDPVWQLGYRIRLEEGAVFSAISGGAVLQETEGFIPGSSVWGALAGSYITGGLIAAGQQPHEDATFHRLFLRGGLRVLNAYPVAPDDPDVRLLPVPLSVFSRKTEPDRAVDRAFADGAAADLEESLVAVNGFCTLSPPTLTHHLPESRFEYHTSRPDRARGRPGRGQGPFVYEALCEGQEFRGLILGDQQDLTSIASIAGGHLRLGRSRSAQYGGVACEFDLTPSLFASEQPWAAGGSPDPIDYPDGLVLTLTSHMIPPLQPGGSGAIAFPFEELAAALATSIDQIRDGARSFARTVVVGGYANIWSLPRRQSLALAAGSAFVFPSVLSAPGDLESVSLGQRTGEGFGRFVAGWQQPGLNVIEPFPAVQALPPTVQAPAAVQDLMRGVAQRRLEDLAVREALLQARGFRRLPSNSQLNRLRRLFQTESVLDALRRLRSLEDEEKAIGEALRRFRREGITFRGVVDSWMNKDLETLPGWTELAPVLGRSGVTSVAREATTKLFALALLEELARLSDEEGRRDGQ